MAAKKLTYLTGRTMNLLRELGYMVEKLEHWSPFGMKSNKETKTFTFQGGHRKDAWGIIDIMAIKGDVKGTLFVQVTSTSNASAHKRSAEERVERGKDGKDYSVLKEILLAENRFAIYDWKKVGNRWTCNSWWPYLIDGEINWERMQITDPKGKSIFV